MMANRRLLLVVVLLINSTPGFATEQLLSPVSPAREAPLFTTQDTQGATHELIAYRGKVLIVNFWATWCAPCILEMPSLQRAWERVQDEGIQVLAINMGQPPEDIARFTAKYPVTFPILLDRDVSIATAWGVRGLPATYVVDRAGRIVFEVIGERTWDEPELLDQVRAVHGMQ